jgi:transmembrane sensor
MSPGSDPRKTSEEAASWNVRLDSGEFTDAERAGLHEWLTVPGNAREYDAQRRLLGWVGGLSSEEKEELEGSLLPRLIKPLRRRFWVAAAGGVLTVAALALMGYLTLLRPPLLTHSYASGIGEVRTVRLPDGSTTALNTQTRLKWLGGKEVRRVELLGGEVLFEVQHNPEHPFRIQLKHSQITVLGTRFDVYEKPDDEVVVTVLTGKVVVQGFSAAGPWSEQLTANQQIQYTPTGSRAVRAVDASTSTYWRNGIFYSEGASLASVVKELARYTSKRIIIADPQLAKLTVGGVFMIHDVPAALQQIAASAPVEAAITVTRSGNSLILGHPPDPATAQGGKGS